jgi:hypothetical protein
MQDPVTAYAELEIGMHAMQAEAIEGAVPYQVELRFTNPNSQAERAPKRGECRIHFENLLTCQSDPQSYGQTLAGWVFANETIRREYGQIKAAVEAEGLFLRVRLMIGPTAPRLHFLHWETLTDPDTKAPLATSERILFSRFITSQDWRGIRLRPEAKLRAIIAVAAPSNLDEYKLADVNLAGEIARAREGLAGIDAKVDGAGEPLTLKRLVDSLREGTDILYLVCHGTLNKNHEPFLFLQDEAGRVARVAGSELALRISELTQPPRLAVLASCESAGTGNAPSAGGELMASQAALAPRLAEAGIPAILAMQGKITMETVKQSMPVFFRELLRDGQIDRAMAVARGAVVGRRDSWMPALFLRLKSGRIWYEPGFAGEGSDFSKWKSICRRVREGKFIPILGPDFGEDLYGGMNELSTQLATQHMFPMATAERSDLAKVTQFLSIDQDRSYAQDAVQKQLLRQVGERSGIPGDNSRRTLPAMLDLVVEKRREDTNDPYRILAELPASIYINASPETMLFKSVKAAGKNPEALYCLWRPTETNHPKEPQPTRDPSPQTPVIYHVFGVFGVKDSLVLTEDDFLDYLIATSTYKLMPKVVRGSLMESSLLFLGFRLDDWTFRVLFRLIMTLEGSAELRQYSHVGVQVNPDEHSLTDVERARKYLESYFTRNRSAGRSEPSIDIYWGSAADFLTDLRTRLGEATSVEAAPVEEEAASGWF